MIKISIIIPVYNGEKYIGKTLDSVFSQTLMDFEVIIINDGSTDASENIILGYTDTRISYYKNNQNLNIVGSRNIGLKNAQGKYICFLDQDDVFIDPDKLQIQYNFLENNHEYGLVGSSAIVIDETGQPTGEIIARTTDSDIRNHIIMSNQFTCGTVLFRRNCIDQIGLLDPIYTKADDYDYWLKIGQISKIENIGKPLFAYRIHKNNTTFQGLNRYKMLLLGFRLAILHGKHYPYFGKQISIRFLSDFIIPNRILVMLVKFFKNKI